MDENHEMYARFIYFAGWSHSSIRHKNVNLTLQLLRRILPALFIRYTSHRTSKKGYNSVQKNLTLQFDVWYRVLYWEEGRLRATIFRSAGTVHLILLCYLGDAIRFVVSAGLKAPWEESFGFLSSFFIKLEQFQICEVM